MLYILKKPTGRKSYDFYLLYEASKFKSRYKATYYIPSLKYIAPVFYLEDYEVNPDVFEPIDKETLSKSYKLICVRCGLCCVHSSAAFAFEHELKAIKSECYPDLDYSLFNFYYVNIPKYGAVKVYELSQPPQGKCFFYQYGGCPIPKRLKPIICLIQYCSLFAEREGKVYMKVASRSDGTPVYKPINMKKFEELRKLLCRRSKRYFFKYLKAVRRKMKS